MSMQHYYLEKMGITPWIMRDSPCAVPSLQQLTHTVANCTQCPLHQTRTQTVFARGNPQAKLMIIGEAPDFHEDQQGQPFVGAAGGLLDQMVACIGLSNEEIYVTNIVKCRPPQSRDPHGEEIAQCSRYLTQQIDLVKPALLLALGRFAAQYLLNTQQSLSHLRERTHHYQDIPVIVTFHPDYLLHHPADKKKAYHDWLAVQQIMQLKISA